MIDDAHLNNLGLPSIDQIGFVVKNLDAWVARYTPMFGPFRLMDGSVKAANFRGKDEDVTLKLAFGRSHGLEIEFIECCDGVSPHSEFIQAGHEGMHHIRYRVDDVAHWITQLKPLGYEPFWYKKYSADTIFVYMEHKDFPLIIEFLQMPENNQG